MDLVHHQPKAYPVIGQGEFKQFNEDFILYEYLGYPLANEGEHLYLYLKKVNLNTDQLIGKLAKCFEVPKRDIGYAGLKDKLSITFQWFSLPVAYSHSKEDVLSRLHSQGIICTYLARHTKKLKQRAFHSNVFSVTLRHVQVCPDALSRRVKQITTQGVPNYFGFQRFGIQSGNLSRAQALFSGRSIKNRQQKSLALSSVRSYLFNEVLAARLTNRTWQTCLPHEPLQLNRKNSYFIPCELDSHLTQRLQEGDIHPTGPLVGNAKEPLKGEISQFEYEVLSCHTPLQDGLKQFGLQAARRALRLIPEHLSYRFVTPNQLVLQFKLCPGVFATSLLRECLNIEGI